MTTPICLPSYRSDALLTITILSLIYACAGTDLVAPAPSGTLAVTTFTSGETGDPDGYTVSLDGGAGRPIGPQARLTLTDISPGVHQVRLDGIASNCAVAGDNPRTATVNAGDTAGVSFSLSCTFPASDLRVLTRTAGPSPDPDGYLLSLDAGAPQPIGAVAALMLRGLEQGNHALAISGLADNCAVNGANPVSFAISSAPGTEIIFEVLCTALTVTTTTSGADPDLDGYLISVDGQAPDSFSVNGTRQIPLAAGSHVVALSGLADNCTLAGADSRTVTTRPAVLSETTFEVSCRSRVAGRARLLYWGGPAVHIYRTGGSTSVDLTPGSNGAMARWAPDRSRIAFETTRNGPAEIFVMNADGSEPTRIARGSAPAWSPDGTRIAFSDPGAGLKTMKPDGTDVRRLTSDPSDAEPAWSPDGTRIAFQRRGTCRLTFLDLLCAVDLYTVAPDGSGPTALTSLQAGEAARDPAWSPDGRRLVYSYGWTFGLPRNLNVLDVGTGAILQLTTTTERWESSPVWSPDGAEIAFADAGGEDIARLVTIPSTGGTFTPIPTGKGPVYPSSWR